MNNGENMITINIHNYLIELKMIYHFTHDISMRMK